MPVQTIVLSNRRDKYLSGALRSLSEFAGVDDPIIVDDSGDADHRARVRAGGLQVVPVAADPGGYTAAMSAVWAEARNHEYVFLFEEDFLLSRVIDLEWMAYHLENNPRVAQYVLLRQPWFGNEIEVGGLIPALEKFGNVFEHRDLVSAEWLEHTATWSCNPTLFRGQEWVETNPWPIQAGSEAEFGRRIYAQGQVSAYWGHGEEWVEHVGIRDGFDY